MGTLVKDVHAYCIADVINLAAEPGQLIRATERLQDGLRRAGITIKNIDVLLGSRCRHIDPAELDALDGEINIIDTSEGIDVGPERDNVSGARVVGVAVGSAEYAQRFRHRHRHKASRVTRPHRPVWPRWPHPRGTHATLAVRPSQNHFPSPVHSLPNRSPSFRRPSQGSHRRVWPPHRCLTNRFSFLIFALSHIGLNWYMAVSGIGVASLQSRPRLVTNTRRFAPVVMAIERL